MSTTHVGAGLARRELESAHREKQHEELSHRSRHRHPRCRPDHRELVIPKKGPTNPRGIQIQATIPGICGDSSCESAASPTAEFR